MCRTTLSSTMVLTSAHSGSDSPEMVGFWSDRLVYTVYLHVWLRKNWILQYSVPRTEDAAAGGNSSRPDGSCSNSAT